MTQTAFGSPAPAAARCTCTRCPMLCDDVVVDADEVGAACGPGSEAIRLQLSAGAGDAIPEALAAGRPVGRAAAIGAAATALSAARRVLVTGLDAATLEAGAAACDLAESLGAAVDAGLPESSRAAGPTIARAGEVTAVWDELRDRADLVIFWCCDPATSHPRFFERFVTGSTADGRCRRTVSVGPNPVMAHAATHRHLRLEAGLAVEAARCLQMILGGRDHAVPDARLAPIGEDLHGAIREAACVAIVTEDAADAIGLEPWSIVHLVRTIAHERPAFQIPLGAGVAAHGPNAAGAVALCTWRYGAAGGIDRADRNGGLFLPAECDARRLIARGEVDAVLILGCSDGVLEAALAAHGGLLAAVQIAARPAAAAGERSLFLRCESPLSTDGTMLREDGRRVVLRPPAPASGPSMRELLVGLHDAVRQRRAPPAGVRP